MRKLLTAFFFLCALPAYAEEIPPSSIAKAQLLVHAPELRKGEPRWAAVLLTMPEGWHVYWKNPGDSGIPPTLTWTLPEGLSAGDIQWPAPERIEISGLVNYGYSGKVLLPVGLTPARDAIAGEVKVKAEWLVCNDQTCIPESATLSVNVPVANPQAATLIAGGQEMFAESNADWKATFNTVEGDVLLSFSFAHPPGIEQATWFPVTNGVISNSAPQTFAVDGGLLEITAKRGGGPLPESWPGVLVLQTSQGKRAYDFTATADAALQPNAPATGLAAALLFAFLGGLILNLMPCVLPILSLKALAIAKKSGAEQAEVRQQGFAYTLGVVATFLAIAGVMLALKSAGAAIGWGFQLQEPAVIAALFLLMVAVTMNLFGAFELPVIGGGAHEKGNAFFTGALAVALATPCTAPFMAAALGATLTLPAVQSLLVFASLGLGMASPFLLISVWPAARKILPKPGVWMLRFKQFLAFPMLATAAWLLWVLVQINGPMGMALALTGGVALAFLLWLYGTRSTQAARMLLLGLALLATVQTVKSQPPAQAMHIAASEEQAVFSEQALADLRAEGKPVFVDATAAWCITCKINERVALQADSVKEYFKEHGITLMVADWTNRDEAITTYLASFGRNGVPLYVYYPTQGEPVVLPQLLTPSLVVKTLTQADKE